MYSLSRLLTVAVQHLLLALRQEAPQRWHEHELHFPEFVDSLDQRRTPLHETQALRCRGILECFNIRFELPSKSH
jgi:hypothetical protein